MTNEVVIGTNEDLMTTRSAANKLNFMTVEDLEGEMRVFAKIRYNHKGDWCTVRKTGEDEIECIFETPQRAVTPGRHWYCMMEIMYLEAEQFWDSSELFCFLYIGTGLRSNQ